MRIRVLGSKILGRSSHPRTTECSQYISLGQHSVTDGHDAARNPATRTPDTQKHTRWVYEVAWAYHEEPVTLDDSFHLCGYIIQYIINCEYNTYLGQGSFMEVHTLIEAADRSSTGRSTGRSTDRSRKITGRSTVRSNAWLVEARNDHLWDEDENLMRWILCICSSICMARFYQPI